jgi:hypothetical protein
MSSVEKWRSDDQTIERRDAERNEADPPAASPDPPGIDNGAANRDESGIIRTTSGVGTVPPPHEEVE